MGLTRKLDALLHLKPDIAIVQECEEALCVPPEYTYTWHGNHRQKGLGVLSRDEQILLEPVARKEWTYFIPLTFPQKRLRLLATWAYYHRAARRFGPACVGNPLDVIAHLSMWLSEGRSIVAGDFNNSVIWDKGERRANFEVLRAQLESLGLHSAYHLKTLEPFGKETHSTLFQYRDPTKTYHIDYCFVHRSLAVSDVAIANFDSWHKLSDHVPVVVDLIN